MELLERGSALGKVESALADARAGQGRVVVVAGEAGIGKTSLAHAFLDSHEDVRVLWGACDDLITPRPLGPFLDLAPDTDPQLEDALLEAAPQSTIFRLLLDELSEPPGPVVMVLEDIHWADEATLDAIHYLGRRIAGLGALLILTVRDLELPLTSPVHSVLGRLVGPATVRIDLEPLSRESVAALSHSRSERMISELYEVTGGNPFYVTEIVATGGKITASVAEAVMARLRRLPEDALRLMELMAVVPTRTEVWLLDAVLPGWTAAAGAVEEAGVAQFDGEGLAFHHELARRALADALPQTRALRLHRQVLDVLMDRGGDAARIAHHAEVLGDEATLVEYLPIAAEQATAAESHREAKVFFEKALGFGDLYEPERRAALHLGLAAAAWHQQQYTDGIEAAAAAVEIRRALDDTEGTALALTVLAQQNWTSGKRDDAYRAAQAALELVEDGPPSVAQARAFAAMTGLSMLDWRFADAEAWGKRAIESAETVDDDEALIRARISLGTARIVENRDDGDLIHSGIELAGERGFSYEAARGMGNVGSVHAEQHRYDEARYWLTRTIEWADERDLMSISHYSRAFLAWTDLDTGDWAAAEENARRVIESHDQAGVALVPALATLGRLQSRRGDPEAGDTLARAWDLAISTGELQRTGWVSLAEAELAWLDQRTEPTVARLEETLQRAAASGFPWMVGEAALWLHRLGALEAVPDGVAEPLRLELEGDWRGAAALWDEIGAPYERALSLLEGDEAAQLEALEILDGLGAAAAAARARSRLKEMGAEHVPRGPSTATRESPAGLTARQTEVLALLAEGLTNPEIADRLFVSKRTVDHHVSAILTRLGVTSRRQAAKRAVELGIGNGAGG